MKPIRCQLASVPCSRIKRKERTTRPSSHQSKPPNATAESPTTPPVLSRKLSTKGVQTRILREIGRTFQGREASVENQLQIAELSLIKHESRKRLSFSFELLSPRRIASNKILEDTACSLSVELYNFLIVMAIGSLP